MKDTFFKNLRLIREQTVVNKAAKSNKILSAGEIRANYLGRHDARNNARSLVRGPSSSWAPRTQSAEDPKSYNARLAARRARNASSASPEDPKSYNARRARDASSASPEDPKSYNARRARDAANATELQNPRVRNAIQQAKQKRTDAAVQSDRDRLQQPAAAPKPAKPATSSGSRPAPRPAASKTPMTVSGYAKQRAAITSKNLGGQPSVRAGRIALAQKTLNTTGGGAKGNMARQRAERDLNGPTSGGR